MKLNNTFVAAILAVLMMLVGCSSPQTFNASQSLDGGVRVMESNKLTNSVAVLTGGQTMNVRSHAEKEFVSLTITDKNGNEIVSVRNAQDFVWQHPVLQAGQARRLIVTLETAALPTNVVEQWEALVLGDRLVDLDNQLAAFAAGDSAPAPVRSEAPARPLPTAPAPTEETDRVTASADTVDLGTLESVRPVAPRAPRRDVAPAPVAAPTPPPAQPALTPEETALLQRLLERANTAPAPASTVPASAPKPAAPTSSDIEEAAPDASALPGAG